MFTVILDDANARSSSWRKENKTTEGTQLEALTSLHNFDQLISEPTHILFHFSSCIDLILTNLIFNKFRLVWDYKKADTESSIEFYSIESVNCKTLYNNKIVNKIAKFLYLNYN